MRQREKDPERGEEQGENIISDLSGGSHLVKFSHHLEKLFMPPKQLHTSRLLDATECLLKIKIRRGEEGREEKRRRGERRGAGLRCDTSLCSLS